MSTANGEKVIVIDIALDEDNNLQKVTEDAITEVGFIKPYAGTSVPTGYLLCNGAAISRAEYPELFAAIGTTWGAGDGASTFNVPDLRGFFLRGVGGNAAALGVEQGDAIREVSGILGVRSGNDGLTKLTVSASGPFYDAGRPEGSGATSWTVSSTLSPALGIGFRISNVVPTAAENRPVNKAVNYCIRYA